MTIETAMVFVLGFVVAALLSLALMGAVWRRAVRLTTRRVESATPLSMAEIKAEKDQVRAEYALAIRRTEVEAERLRETANLQTIEIAKRTETIRDLNAELDARAARIAGLESTRASLEEALAESRRFVGDEKVWVLFKYANATRGTAFVVRWAPAAESNAGDGTTLANWATGRK